MAPHGGRDAATELGPDHPAVTREPLTLVVDASVAVAAATIPDGFAILRDDELVAPHLMWSEARSALHEALHRRELSAALAERALERLEDSPVARRTYARLGHDAWNLAEALGWAKTYDAEYVVLAQHIGCRLVTLDRRLRRGADRLGLVVTPDEL